MARKAKPRSPSGAAKMSPSLRNPSRGNRDKNGSFTMEEHPEESSHQQESNEDNDQTEPTDEVNDEATEKSSAANSATGGGYDGTGNGLSRQEALAERKRNGVTTVSFIGDPYIINEKKECKFRNMVYRL